MAEELRACSTDIDASESGAQRLRLRPAKDPDQWDAMALAFPEATPFHGFDLLSGMSGLFGWKFRPMLAEEAGVPVGLVPLVTLGNAPVTPRIPFPYVGPLVAHGLLAPLMRSVRCWQRRAGQLVVRLALPPSVGRVELVQRGVEVVARNTYVLDLEHGSIERYEAGLHGDRRQGLRRAARAGVQAQVAGRGEVSALLPGLLKEAYSRHGATPPYPAGVATWIDARIGDGVVHATTVRDSLGPLGLLVAVRCGDTMFGWLGAARRTGAARDAGTVAYDALIRTAIGMGVRRFDFVGHVDEGVGRFKRSFGAVPTLHWDVTSNLLPFDPDRILDLRRRVGRHPG